MSGAAEGLSLPPERAIAFFDGKVNIGTDRWTDVWKAAHDRGFMVAGVQAQDVLAGVRGAIAKALREGTTLTDFRRDLAPLMQRLGWESRGKAYLAWRTRLVYETNLRGAYAAGAYEQATDPDVLAALPFWRYRHSGARDPRPEHQAWDGRVLRHDDAWWRTHHPPNGWGCGCWVEQLSPRDMTRLGKSGPDEAPPIVTRPWTNPSTGQVEQVPRGIDPGWDYNVGASWRQARDLPPSPQAPPAGWVPEAPPAPEPRAAVPAAVRPAVPVAAAPVAPAAPFEPREWSSVQDADDALSGLYASWAAGLSPAQRLALFRYKGAEHAPMNAHLRSARAVMPETATQIAALAAALRRAVVPADLVVRRGVDASEWRMWSRPREGAARIDKGMTSASISAVVAGEFGEGGGVVEIRVRAGYRGAAYVHRVPQVQGDEFELLFAPGTRFRVIAREAARIVVEVERRERRGRTGGT